MMKNRLIMGTFILTATGLITRFIGFFFRMFLSHTFGAEQVGLYQLIFPIYGLCFSLSSAGIETALSRSVAQKISKGKRDEADCMLYQALLISFALSLILGIVIRSFASPISIYILGDSRCEPLLSAISYSLPFASIHSCIVGYYLGQKQTKVPALSQFIEQIGRVGAVYIIYQITLNSHKETSILFAVLGIAIGEAAATIFCLHAFTMQPHEKPSISVMGKFRHLYSELLSLAVPLTSNRVLMNLLQSVETISIPLCLQRYGYSNTEALSTYGVLTGMAFPCIFFPTALTSSVSTMLLPTVAEIQAAENVTRLKGLIRKVIFFGIGLGSICGAVFLLFGSFIGNLLFNSSLAGDYIRTLAWICPFMYMNSTLISILNGLGKATITFLINTSGLALRILGVWGGIPVFGMQGYLWGLLASQLTVSILCINNLLLYVKKRIA